MLKFNVFILTLFLSFKTYSQVQGYPSAPVKYTYEQAYFLNRKNLVPNAIWLPDSIVKKFDICVSPIAWDSTIYYTTCGLGWKCTTSCKHYRLLSERGKYIEIENSISYGDDDDGIPIYGPENSYLGVLNKYGFCVTCRRDHLNGKLVDSALLENETALIKYLKTKGINYATR